jgi:hypothetical protein
MKPFNAILNISMMKDSKHEIITSYQYFLCNAFGESLNK